MWCDLLVWMQFVGLLMDAAGVLLFTLDVLPEFNTHRAYELLWPVRRKLEALISGSAAMNASADGLVIGRPAIQLHEYKSEVFAEIVHSSVSQLNLEEMQRLLRKVESALDPLGFLGPRNAPFPTDVEGVHRLYAELVRRTDGFENAPGSRNRWPLHVAALLLILGFVIQAVGSLPTSVVGCLAT